MSDASIFGMKTSIVARLPLVVRFGQRCTLVVESIPSQLQHINVKTHINACQPQQL